MNRREFLRVAGATALRATVGGSLWTSAARADPTVSGTGPYGPLEPADANGLMLPAGFRSCVVARGDELVAGTGHVWHTDADGGAVFRIDGGYVYVSNSERMAGGAGAIEFDYSGNIVDSYSICSGTRFNCAGGATPWGTWLSCEELIDGLVYECDPRGTAAAVARPALGSFAHEAVAVDPMERRLYLTEDASDGLFYRFTPDSWQDLSSGLLEAAIVTAGVVSWATVPTPNPDFGAMPPDPATRYQVPGAMPFNGGEGIVYHADDVYLTTKGDSRVWDYDLASSTLSVLYDDNLDPGTQLTHGDNLTASRSSDLIVAEDPGNLELVILTPDCVAAPLVRVTGQSGTELTGPAFEPLRRRLYFSSQRGGTGGDGITYEVEGPFRRTS